MVAENLDDIEFGRDGSEAGRRRISILLTILALLLWSHSILFARFEIGHWGLINGLPVTFFIGLALLTVASAILWVSREKHSQLLCLQLFILVLALSLVPLMTGASSPFTTTLYSPYRSLGYVDYIVRQAHFDTQVTFYLGWPGAFVLSSVVVKLGSINLVPVTEALIALLPLLFLLPLYVFLKNILGENRSNYVWAGCWLFYLADWGGPANLTSAPGAALFFLLVMLALVTNPRIWQKDGKSLVILSLIVVAFAAVAVSHLLTSMVALGILFALSLIRWDKRLALTAVVCLAIWLVWNLFCTGNFLINQLRFLQEGKFIFNIGAIVQREITSAFLASGTPADVARLKLLQGVLFALIGFAGFMASLVMGKRLKDTLSLLAIAVVSLPMMFISGFYASEMLNRVYAFALAGMAYFAVRLFDINRKVVAVVLCLLLCLIIPLSIMTTYGNAERDYFSPAQQQGTFLFHDKTSQGLVFGSRPVGQFRNIEYYANLRLDKLEWDDSELVIDRWFRKYSAYYIGISRQDIALYGWFLGETLFIPGIEQRLQDATSWDFVYNNPDMQFYIYEGD